MASQQGKQQRLPDRIQEGCRILFVGINPGLKSASVGHHYAGPGNRFWKLLFDSGIVERPVGFSEDDRLPEYGLGLTNIAERPTRGSGDLSREDFESGRIKLLRKIRRFRPEVVAFVGVIAYRACFHARGRVQCGLARERIAFSRVFVLPNTSGRNAHTGYSEMLKLFKELRQEAGA